MKKFFMPILLLLIISFVGCNSNNFFDFTRGKREHEFIKYLENKYDQKFEFDSMDNSDSWLSNSTREEAICYPKNGDKEKESFKVIRYKENNKYIYEDQYYINLIIDEYTDRVKSILNNQFSKYKVKILFGDTYFGEDIDESVSLDDAIQQKIDLYSDVVVVVDSTCNNEEFEKKTYDISTQIAKLKLPMALTIFYSSTGNLDEIDTNNINAKMYRCIYVSRDYDVKIMDVTYNK